MPSAIPCPECGGMIGVAASRGGCICSNVPVATAAQPEPAAGAAGEVKKICCSCGKDVSGRTRFRDDRGYWCKECHEKDQKAREAREIAEGICPGCGRKFPPEKLILFEGERHCITCERQRQKEVLAKLRKAAKVTRYRRFEKRRVLVLLWIVLTLLLIILLQWWGII